MGRVLGPQFADEAVEIIRFLKVLVDAGKAYIGHGVDPGQAFHHDLAHGFRGNIGLAHAFQPSHNAGNHLFDALGLYGSFLERDADRAFQLVAVEILAPTIGFHNYQIAQLHALIGGETTAAARAKPAPADRDMLFRWARILDLCVDISAKRAAHWPSPFSVLASWIMGLMPSYPQPL
ncbi:hypothetical protein RV420_360566 [Roseovarius sp. EC-SD190]|nr:hypothetical protein RV420_360566 [Roseovarius sp. EC-SD190]